MNQRTRLTKLMFRKALAQLMKDKHISQISIREICEKAELNRSTFYLHYKNVYDLLEEIENEIAAEADKAIDFKKPSPFSKVFEGKPGLLSYSFDKQ